MNGGRHARKGCVIALLASLGLVIRRGLGMYAARKCVPIITGEGLLMPEPGRDAVLPGTTIKLKDVPQYDLLRGLRIEVQTLQRIFADVNKQNLSLEKAKAGWEKPLERGEAVMKEIESRGVMPSPNDRAKTDKKKHGKATHDETTPTWWWPFGEKSQKGKPGEERSKPPSDPGKPGVFVAFETLCFLRDNWDRICTSPVVTGSPDQVAAKAAEAAQLAAQFAKQNANTA